MENWKVILNNLDDDYLVGMTNKGIVKRAYKDMEAGEYRVISAGEEAQVSVGAETVVIRQLLGESTCTCPSRTICRHVVLGILALKQFAAGEESGEEVCRAEGTQENNPADEEAGQKKESAEEGQPEEQEKASEGSLPETEEAPGTKEAAKKSGKTVGKPENAAGNHTETSADKQDLKSRLLAEISAFPPASLKKVLGTKQLVALVSQKRSGQLPKITYSSIITVQLPKGGHTVKLLSPLEYSSCTCHKKEFCTHKAAAVLWCKLEAGEVTEEELNSTEELQDYAMGEVKDAARQMGAFLTELLDTGLARTSPDVLDYLDRLALISHNAKLANFEGYWRALHDSYGNYLKRKASFQTQRLMEQFARLYERVELLARAADAADAVQVAGLAGEFRSEYVPVGNLSLAGIAIEHFESQTGYEGETVYFLEENTKEWYTYTSARPVFYEETGRRGRQEKAAAPWGLPVSVKEMVGLRLHLSGARCDARGRLSSSAETKGEVTGSCQKENCLHTGELTGWYYRDFGKLFAEKVADRRVPWLKSPQGEQRDGDMVFLRPYSFTRGEFSQTEQKLVMWLYDRAGREIVLELAYSKREEWGIGYLERLTEDMEPCFLGKLYFKDGRMRLYPVTVFEKGELTEDLGQEEGSGREESGSRNIGFKNSGNAGSKTGDSAAERGGHAQENAACGGEPTGDADADEAGAASRQADNGAEDEIDCGKIEVSGDFGVEGESVTDVLGRVLEDAGSLLEELYQSGLDTVHDSTLDGLARMGKLAEQYGLAHLAEMLAQLADGAGMRRHRLERRADGLAEVYVRACEYVYLCRGKVEIDQGLGYYNSGGSM